MSSELKADIGPAVYFIRAVKFWIITAAIALLILSVLAFFFDLTMPFLTIACSFISFISCATAGAAAQRTRRGGAIYTGMLIGVAICVLLLTLGFAVKGTEIESDGVLSVSTFSIAGALFGSVFLGGTCAKKPKKRQPKRQ